MKIWQNDKVLNVAIYSDINIFYYLKSIIDKNFNTALSSRNKIIVFNDTKKEVEKKYFLKLLSRIYAKATNKKKKSIWQIEKAINKTIKIKLIKKNQLQNIVELKIDTDKSKRALIIKLNTKNRLILRGVENIFAGYTLLYYPSINSIYIQGFNDKISDKIKEFIGIKEILGNFIKFHYDETIFKDIKEIVDIDAKTKNIKKAKVILDDFYRLLNCTLDDPYEKVRNNYLALAKKYHPDNLLCDNSLILKVYTKKFQKIQTAYKTIKEYHSYISSVA